MDVDTVEKGIILMVDDTPTNLGVLFESLSNSGFKLLVAEDGESALNQIRYVKPDIILLDVMMPGMDGFETCRRLKADPKTADIPVIFMTALAETANKVKGFNAGGVDYITKPFQSEEVLARISIHLKLRSLQCQLQASNQVLQEEVRDRKRKEEALRLFLHAVSHDLRNPVTGMLMVLKNLLKGQPPTLQKSEVFDAEVATTNEIISVPRPILERMLQGSNRQLSLIDSLLEAHTSEIHGITLHRQPLQLGHLIQELVTEMQPTLNYHQTILINQVPQGLPLVNADPTQIWRVIENLIANAILHNSPGLRLTLTAQVRNSTIRCTVEDDGIGLSPEQCEHLFDLYARGPQARGHLGLGLGLYLCRQIIAAHDGNIGAIRKPETGAIFWYTLPLAQ